MTNQNNWDNIPIDPALLGLEDSPSAQSRSNLNSPRPSSFALPPPTPSNDDNPSSSSSHPTNLARPSRPYPLPVDNEQVCQTLRAHGEPKEISPEETPAERKDRLVATMLEKRGEPGFLRGESPTNRECRLLGVLDNSYPLPRGARQRAHSSLPTAAESAHRANPLSPPNTTRSARPTGTTDAVPETRPFKTQVEMGNMMEDLSQTPRRSVHNMTTEQYQYIERLPEGDGTNYDDKTILQIAMLPSTERNKKASSFFSPTGMWRDRKRRFTEMSDAVLDAAGVARAFLPRCNTDRPSNVIQRAHRANLLGLTGDNMLQKLARQEMAKHVRLGTAKGLPPLPPSPPSRFASVPSTTQTAAPPTVRTTASVAAPKANSPRGKKRKQADTEMEQQPPRYPSSSRSNAYTRDTEEISQQSRGMPTGTGSFLNGTYDSEYQGESMDMHETRPRAEDRPTYAGNDDYDRQLNAFADQLRQMGQTGHTDFERNMAIVVRAEERGSTGLSPFARQDTIQSSESYDERVSTFTEQMTWMRDRGFLDFESNINALFLSGGSAEAAIENFLT